VDCARAALQALPLRACSIGAACSGGADSTALLLALAELRDELGFELSAVHLNHRLRGDGSAADEAFVRELAASLGLPVHVRSLDVQALGGNLEQAGRQARHAFFAELIQDGSCDLIATGHTLSDQAETVLFRLVRGSGLRGLRGIQPRRQPGLLRPLLGVSGEQVRDWLRRRGARWREDPSNVDRRFSRNRIRLDLAPALATLNPRWQEALARTAAQGLDEEQYWEEVTSEAAEQILDRLADGVRIPVSAFSVLRPALQRRLLRRAVEEAGGGQPAWDHIESLRELFRPGLGTGRVSTPGLTARRSFDAVLLSPGGCRQPPLEEGAEVQPPMELEAPDGRSRLQFEIASQHVAGGRYTERTWSRLDWNGLAQPLVLRCWRPGDRWSGDQPGRSSKLKELLQKARVEVWDRPRWPVLAAGDEVVWTRGFGVSAPRRAGEGTERILVIRETDPQGREIRGIEPWRRAV
jgi:tRNA(Ile)-lysidine synthase